MAMKILLLAILVTAAMCGCSSQPGTPAASQPAPTKAPESITGSSAFFKCYIAARGWAQDAQPFRVESAPSKTGDGKAGEWRSSFASAAQHSTKAFTWSNGDISHGTEDTYSPTNSSTQVFNVQFLKVDSDKAFTSRNSTAERSCWRIARRHLFCLCSSGTTRRTSCSGM